MDFIDIEIAKERISQLYQIPKLSKTVGRYKKHDLGIFDDRQIAYVKEMGFTI